jgi:FkbM family methyltransferase
MATAISKARAYVRGMALQVGVSEGPRGALRVLDVLARGRLGKGSREPRPVGVPMRALQGRELFVRPGSSDLRNASYYYSGGLYLPPPQLVDGDLRRICEVGTNIGAALSALAVRYPGAQLLGAEPDPGNAALASRNVAGFGERCQVVQAGVWEHDAELVVDRDTHYGEHGFMVRPRIESDPAEISGIQALSIDSLLERHMPEGDVDYMHMTIEGTEPRVLSAGGKWPLRVRSLRVEAHPEFGYPAARCVEDLRNLGYEAEPDQALPDKWVFAVRP